MRRRESADPVFFFCFFFVRKKISQKIFFDSIIKAKRVPTVFLQKSLIFFSSKREKSVEYRVRGTFPEKSFRRQVVKSEKSVEYRVRKFFSKNFSLKPQKSVEYRVRGLSLKKKFPLKGYQTRKKCGIKGEGKNNPPGSLTTE